MYGLVVDVVGLVVEHEDRRLCRLHEVQQARRPHIELGRKTVSADALKVKLEVILGGERFGGLALVPVVPDEPRLLWRRVIRRILVGQKFVPCASVTIYSTSRQPIPARIAFKATRSLDCPEQARYTSRSA